jgi:hypothetical protein
MKFRNYNYIWILVGFVCHLQCQDNPSQFDYNQSTLQAFYFIENVMIDGYKLEADDWVGAFYNDICVGARQWDASNCGGMCDVPVMGDDGSEFTNGYIVSGEIPQFKVYDASTDEIIEMDSLENIGEWTINGFNSNYFLVNNLNLSINDYQFNGSATIQVQLQDNQVIETDTLLAIINGDLRGKQGALESPLSDLIFPVMMYSNVNNGENVQFYLYRDSSNEVIQIEDELEFISDMTLGTAIDPVIITDCSGDFDDCGVCDGDNSSCTDCNGDVNGDAFTDGCSECVGGDTGTEACINDCAGVVGGNAEWNECGTCICNSSAPLDGFNCVESEVCIAGCDGFWYNDGNAPLLDNCGVCDGDNSSCSGCTDSIACNYDLNATIGDNSCTFPESENVDCSGNCIVEVDCAGECGGLAEIDECGVCGGIGPEFKCIDGSIKCLATGCEYIKPSSNYPNPFSDETSIKILLNENDFGTLEIFNILGEKIDIEYWSGESGEVIITWNSHHIPVGIYLYKLSYNSGLSVYGKMTKSN